MRSRQAPIGVQGAGIRLIRLTVVAVGLIASLALAACGNPAAPQGNYGNIAGIITSSSGQPIAGATITVDYGPYATSGPDGKYLVPGVPITTPTVPAVINVKAPPGYQNPAPRMDVQVQAGQTTQNINFVLTPA